MSSPQRRRPQGRNQPAQPARKPKPVELWHAVPELPPPTPVAPGDDPTALLRSLGDPPLPGQGAASHHYLAVVVERAAGLATALAATAGQLASPDEE